MFFRNKREADTKNTAKVTFQNDILSFFWVKHNTFKLCFKVKPDVKKGIPANFLYYKCTFQQLFGKNYLIMNTAGNTVIMQSVGARCFVTFPFPTILSRLTCDKKSQNLPCNIFEKLLSFSYRHIRYDFCVWSRTVISMPGHVPV